MEEARANVDEHCKKLVHNLVYEARLIAVRSYKAIEGYKMKDKKTARGIHLQKEEYMQVILRWCVDKGECWERMVDYWCSPQYMEKHLEYKNRRAAMVDPPHHQGNLNLKGYAEHWAAHNNAPEPNLFMSYALAHKGSFKSAQSYDENDTSSMYTSKTAYNRLSNFRAAATELKGPEYDVTSEPLDHELVMISGDGRKHGKEAIGSSMFPRSSRRTLPEYKARSSSSKSAIRQRSTPAMVEMEARLTEERRIADEGLEARLVEERRLAAERLAEDRRQYFEIFAAWCTQNGMPLLQMPSAYTPHQSGHGSNNDGSSHAPGPSGSNLGGSPIL